MNKLTTPERAVFLRIVTRAFSFKCGMFNEQSRKSSSLRDSISHLSRHTVDRWRSAAQAEQTSFEHTPHNATAGCSG